jgi:IclR family transcriptional regulator, acetate operon repressor
MTVKRVRSAERVLATLEALAESQPIGVGALARLLDEDKSATQRALVTLHAAGWIRPVAGALWELSTRASVVALRAERRSGLRTRARPVLEALRDETGETTLLAVADRSTIVVVDVVESGQLVRTAPHVGLVVDGPTSAAGRAILAHMDEADLVAFLGRPVDTALSALLARERARGWSLNDRAVAPGASAVGAAVLGSDGGPIGSITISAPASRLPRAAQRAWGERVRVVARELSEPTAHPLD